jgi:hypothetical protein
LRLANDQTSFLNAYKLCVIGNVVLVLTFLVLKPAESKVNELNQMSRETAIEFLGFLKFGLILGLTSILVEESSLRNPISKSLTSLGVLAYCLFLWKQPKSYFNNDQLRLFLLHSLGIANIIFLYYHSNFSKGPLFAPFVIFIYRNQIWKKKLGKFGFASLAILLSFSGLTVFNRLQERHLGAGYVAAMQHSLGKLPWYFDWMRPIANRFDLYSSVSDAYFAGKGALGGFREFMSYIFNSLLWNPSSGRIAQTYGQVWNQRVTSISLPDSQLSPVSLAQGSTADGWVWFGLKGVIFFNFIFGISVVIMGRLLSSGSLSAIFAMAVVGSNVFFEAGIIELTRLLNLGVKVWIVSWVFLNLNRKRWKLVNV